MKTTIIEPGKVFDDSLLRKGDPEKIVVTNGQSWKCPVYVQSLPPCRSECPSSEDIRGYLTQVAQSDIYKRDVQASFDEAWYILTDKNPMPATHGRICPHPCEKGCNRQHLEDGSVAINNFERYIGDHGLKRGLKFKKLVEKSNNKKIAVIGSGPSGLSCAYQLARRGYKVTIYEGFEKPGGMLRYGIPQYRLPVDILDKEIQNILDLGIELKCNTRIGVDIDFNKIKKDYDAVYLAIGAHKGVTIGIDGEDSANVFTGASYLNRVKSGAKVEIGKNVVVIGGGDSAVDAARTSLRLLSSSDDEMSATDGKTALDSARVTKRMMEKANVTILYRRTQAEMPAIAEDVNEAIKEGIKMEFLAAPIEFAVKDGRATAIKCVRMQLGEPDKSGRRRPEPIPGSEFSVNADTVIVGIGQAPELPGGLAEIANAHGWVEADKNHETRHKGIFAGGDALGLGISTKSVGQGRIAAEAMDDFLSKREYRARPQVRPISFNKMRRDYYPPMERHEEEELPVNVRTTGFEEIKKTLSMEHAIAESKRCMSCGLCFVCDQCRVHCPREAISKDIDRPKGKTMFTDYTRCNGCHICAEACPCGYIEMGMGL
ncbi:MAG: NAD(P)-binding protein [Nitrospinota bacterium]|nr:NAD(P)-binding protein [Nitrospinota bacterium]